LNERDLEYIAAKIADMLSFQPRWMKLKQAAAYSSISPRELIKLLKNKKVIGFQDKSLDTAPWIVDRRSIDKYRANQASQFEPDDDENFAIELVAGLDI